MSDHDVRGGRLYKGGFGEKYEKALIKALKAMEEYSVNVKNEPFAEYIAPPVSQTAWESYRGAVCAHAAARKIELSYRPYSLSKQFREFLSSVMKHVENIVREQCKLTGRLRSYELDPEFASVIERAIGTAEKPIEQPKREETEESRAAKEYAQRLAAVDISKAEELEHESWENTKLLLDAIGEELEYEEEPEVIEPEITEEEEETDVWQDFMDSLTELEMNVINILAHGGDTNEIDSMCAAEFTFSDAVYDSINEKAADYIGDILIDKSDVPMIIEDYCAYFE